MKQFSKQLKDILLNLLAKYPRKVFICVMVFLLVLGFVLLTGITLQCENGKLKLFEFKKKELDIDKIKRKVH